MMVKTLLASILLILLVFPISALGLQVSQGIKSYGAIRYDQSYTLRVSESRIVNSWGREVRLKGFNVWSKDIYTDNHMPLTVEHFKQIKGWGLNVVRNTGWWGKQFEPYQDQPGVYNENYLSRLEQTIINANKAGLYFIISVRVSYDDNDPPDSQGWARHRHLLQEEYLNRFCKLWEMLVQRFDKYPNVVGYCPWHFPWHRTSINDTIRTQYNTVITPRLINTIRKYSGKIIFWAPIHCQPTELQVLTDKNVVYMHEDYQPYQVTHQGQAWNYYVESLRKYKKPAVEFMNKYNVPLIITEFGINWHNYPEDQTRLDYLDAQLELFEEFGYSWLYWWYTKPPPGFAVLDDEGKPTPVVNLLEKYNKTQYG